MDIDSFTKPTGQFLKAEKIKSNPDKVFIITGEAKVVRNEKFDVDRLHVEGEFDNEEVILDLSRTNARFISKKLGIETKSWIGKSLILETYRTKTQDGKLVDAINVKDIK